MPLITVFVLSTFLKQTSPKPPLPPEPAAIVKVIQKPKPVHKTTSKPKKITEADNPQHCDESHEWIASEPPFYCIEKTPPEPQTPVVEPPSASDNEYEYHSCTWWVKYNRPDIPNTWGDATDWYYNAQAEGYSTGTTPQAGAVGWVYGHVVYVFSVNDDGTITIGDGNYDYNGSYRVRETSPSEFTYYIY